MTSHQLKVVQGFIEEHYEEFEEYLGHSMLTGDQRADKEHRHTDGAADADEIYNAISDAISFAEETE
jgi:hypothetical protein